MPLDELRIQRYNAKINFIVQACSKIKLNYSNELEKDGIFYNIQTGIEASMDIAAMFAKDFGKSVGGVYQNLNYLQKNGLITSEIADKLRKANGLRNVVVHNYNGIDEEIILNSIETIKETLKTWIQRIGEILDENQNN